MDKQGIRTVDYHTAGEPFRIVTSDLAIPGDSVAARRTYAQRSETVDEVRRLLCFEPRGHADMYGGFLVPPDDDGAHVGIVFWHKDGYSTACGHGTIALATWLVESGRVKADGGRRAEVIVDVPSGRVRAHVELSAEGTIARVAFLNVPSYVIAEGVSVATSVGTLRVDVAYGGAIYASLSADQAGLSVEPNHLSELVRIGREIKWALNDSAVASHDSDDRLSGIYGTIWHDELPAQQGQVRQRNVTVFADGAVDRSPCGSGTSARVALLDQSGRLAPGMRLIHESIVGTSFEARVVRRVDGGVETEVSGSAYKTGDHVFVLDPADALRTGFVLR